jgi:cell division control protein 6
MPTLDMRTVVGRETQLKAIEKCIGLVRQRQSQHLFLYGPPGSGKTVCVKSALESNNADFVYVNCWEYSTRLSLLAKLCIELGWPAPRKGVPCDFLFERLEACLKRRQAGLIIVLDDMDQLSKKSDILFDLLNLCERRPLTIIAISQSERALVGLDGRVLSRFLPVKVEFPAYTKEQLLDIIGHTNSKLDFQPLEVVVDYIAEHGGDCRIALECLNRAARFSQKPGAAEVLKVLNDMR